jgi:hypothetical protein
MPALLAGAKSGLLDLADYAKSPVSWQDFLPGDGRLLAGIDLIRSQKIAGWHNFSVPHSRFAVSIIFSGEIRCAFSASSL